MRQKISYFNKNLYRHTLVRFWPIWAAYFCVWLFPLLGVPDSLRYMNDVSDITRFLQYSLPSSLYQIGILTSFIFAAFAAMAVFSHLYTIRSAGAFGALPLRRECVFLTQTAAGLTAFWAVNILGLCLYCVVIGAYGHLSLFLPSAMHLFAQFCLLNLLFFGFAVLCAQLTGHVLVLPVVYVVLLFTVIVVETIVRQLLSDILFGFLSSGSRLDFLSPVVKLLSTTGWRPVYADEYRTFLNTEFTGWEYLAGYAVAGLVFLLLGLCLSRRRRMESAGDVVAVRPLRPVFKYCLAVGCALVLCVLLLEILFYQSLGTDLLLRIILLLLLGAFIGYFTAQMLLEKSFRALKHGWPGFGILAAVLIALTCALEFDLFGLEKALPDPSKISSVHLSSAGYYADFETPENIDRVLDLQAGIVSNKDSHENAFDETYSVSVRYYDEDGKEIMRRRYPVRTESGDMASVLALLNDPEAIMDRVSVGLPVTEEYIHNAYVSYYEPETMLYTELSLTPEQAVELYEDCILPDCREGNLGRAWIGRDDRYYAEYCANSIGIELLSPTKDPEGDYYSGDSFGINVEMTAKRTVNWLKAHGIPILTQGELYVHQLSEEKYDPVYSGAAEVSVYSVG